MPGTAGRTLADPAATEAFARELAVGLVPGNVICLWGDLGAGKTALARGVITALGFTGEVPSPTFNLVLTYDTPRGLVWHFDLYRIDDPAEVLELGIEDALADGIVLIEWPDRLGAMLPDDRLDIELGISEDGLQRQVSVQARGTARNPVAGPC